MIFEFTVTRHIGGYIKSKVSGLHRKFTNSLIMLPYCCWMQTTKSVQYNLEIKLYVGGGVEY
jgi:hypothetical protein